MEREEVDKREGYEVRDTLRGCLVIILYRHDEPNPGWARVIEANPDARGKRHEYDAPCRALKWEGL